MRQKDLHDKLSTEMHANHDRIATLARPLDPERLVRRPAPGSWSVGEVLEHLVLMDAIFLKPLIPLVARSRMDATSPYRQYEASFVGRKIAESLENPKPLTSPRAARPRTPRGGVVEAFLASDTRFDSLMHDASAHDWNLVRLRPPVAPWIPLRINIGDVFNIHMVHVRRHLAQIERILAT